MLCLMNERPHIQSSYLSDIYDPERGRTLLAWLQKVLEPRRRDFDVLAFRGSSGVPALAAGLILNIPCIHVRKEPNHSGYNLEGVFAGPRVAIIDDLACSGETLLTIQQQLKNGWPSYIVGGKPRITHVFLYAQDSDSANYPSRQPLWNSLGNPSVVCRLQPWHPKKGEHA